MIVGVVHQIEVEKKAKGVQNDELVNIYNKQWERKRIEKPYERELPFLNPDPKRKALTIACSIDANLHISALKKKRLHGSVKHPT